MRQARSMSRQPASRSAAAIRALIAPDKGAHTESHVSEGRWGHTCDAVPAPTHTTLTSVLLSASASWTTAAWSIQATRTFAAEVPEDIAEPARFRIAFAEDEDRPRLEAFRKG